MEPLHRPPSTDQGQENLPLPAQNKGLWSNLVTTLKRVFSSEENTDKHTVGTSGTSSVQVSSKRLPVVSDDTRKSNSIPNIFNFLKSVKSEPHAYSGVRTGWNISDKMREEISPSQAEETKPIAKHTETRLKELPVEVAPPIGDPQAEETEPIVSIEWRYTQTSSRDKPESVVGSQPTTTAAKEADSKNKSLLEKRDKLVSKYRDGLEKYGLLPDGSPCKVYNRIKEAIDALAATKDPAKIEKLDKVLKLTIGYLKIDPLKNKMVIGIGQAKIAIEVASDDKTHVLYNPVTGSIFSKKAELESEVGKGFRGQVAIIRSVRPDISQENAEIYIKEFGSLNNILSIFHKPPEPIKENELKYIKNLLVNKYGVTSNVAIDVVGDFMKLASAQKELRELSKNLAFNLEKLQGPERLGSKFTVKTDKAECDLDSAVTEGVKDQNGVRHQLTEEQIVSLGDDILNAYVALHRLGFVHGDSKLENILLLIDKDGNNYAQLIDLGKLEVVSANQAVLNKGNQRTCPPEGKVSHRGETYSVGMMLIQMFEQSILRDKMAKNPNDNMLISTPNVDSSKKVAKNRNGLEKFAVQNKNMSQSESFLGRVSTIGDILLNAITGKVSNQDAEKEIYTYVYALVNEKNKIVMNDNSKTPQEKADLLKRNNDFGALLRSMLTSDRNARITMNEAQNRYRRIFGIQREV